MSKIRCKLNIPFIAKDKELLIESKKILQSFQEGGMAENVAYTTLEDMNPRC